jgi:ubiquinone/menaquinone biosynthesis C-methylase UbiE
MADTRRAEPPMAKYLAAHRLAFAPLLFQAARVARDNGLLTAVERAGQAGLTPAEAAAAASLPLYATRVLLEACLSADLVELEGERYHLTGTGRLVLSDPMTRVNMDFTHDVCYQGAFHLDESLAQGKPAGLQVFGQAFGSFPTIYEGLTRLPDRARASWFAFDHYFSDRMFPQALRSVFAHKPRTLLDVGGNTGRWALACTRHDPNVKVTILDHPAQLELAQAAARDAGVQPRISGHPMDLLDHTRPFPPGHDAVWMSQFLDCFPEPDITHLLRRGREALAPAGRLYIVETYWDRQPNEIARLCLHATSLYFACMANGTSRMYHSEDLKPCITAAGLEIAEEQQLGFHTLTICTARR